MSEMQEGLSAGAVDQDNPGGIVIPDYVEPEAAPPDGVVVKSDFVFTDKMKRDMVVVFAMNAMYAMPRPYSAPLPPARSSPLSRSLPRPALLGCLQRWLRAAVPRLRTVFVCNRKHCLSRALALGTSYTIGFILWFTQFPFFFIERQCTMAGLPYPACCVPVRHSPLFRVFSRVLCSFSLVWTER